MEGFYKKEGGACYQQKIRIVPGKVVFLLSEKQGSYPADDLIFIWGMERAHMTDCFIGTNGKKFLTDQLKQHFWERLKPQLDWLLNISLGTQHK